MLTVTENTTQQINAALFEQDQNVKNKLSTVSGVVSAVYGACEWIFNKLKDTLARVATTGSYNDLTDKPTIVDTVAQNVPNAVSSNAVYGALTNVNAIEQTPNKKVTLMLNGSASPDSATALNVCLHFPFYAKNTNYTYNVKSIFIENIGQRNTPSTSNIRKIESGFSFLITGLSGLSLYNAYNIRFAEVEITFA